MSRSSRRKNQLTHRNKDRILTTPSNSPLGVQTASPTNTRLIATQTVAEFSSGPIPSPEKLIAYNEAFPNAAKDIFEMANRQSIHRQSIEQKVIYSGAFRATLGVICAAILCLCFLAGGIYCIINNHDWAGATIIVSALGGLVTTFIYGTNSQKTERIEKQKQSDKLINKK